MLAMQTEKPIINSEQILISNQLRRNTFRKISHENEIVHALIQKSHKQQKKTGNIIINL